MQDRKNTSPSPSKTHQDITKSKVFIHPRRGNEILYKKVFLALMQKDKKFGILPEEQKLQNMSLINIAYELAKSAHRAQKRIGGERYFNHITSVTTILIDEFPNITFVQVVAALLHDVVEDTHITLATIENIFGSRVANIVDAVTKKPDVYYLWLDEKDRYETLSFPEKRQFLQSKKSIIKQRRTEHYFGHMADLDKETLQVKFSDRIHNLRDLTHCAIHKIKDQITETEIYMLPLAQKINKTAYTLLKKELESLHKLVGE